MRAVGGRPRAPAAPVRVGGAESDDLRAIGEEEAIIDVTVRRASSPPAGPSPHPHRARRRLDRDDSCTWFNQPWIANTHAEIGPDASRRPGASPKSTSGVGGLERGPRLRGARRPRADLPAHRGLGQRRCGRCRGRGDRARRAGDRCRPRPRRGAPWPLRAEAVRRCITRRTKTTLERARTRLAFEELLHVQLTLRRRSASAGARPTAPPRRSSARSSRALPFTLTTRRSGRSPSSTTCAGRFRCTPHPGGRGLRKDRGRAAALLPPSRRAPGRDDGADGDPRRAALPDAGGAARTELGVRVALLTSRRGPRSAPRRRNIAPRSGRRPDRHRDARAHPGEVEFHDLGVAVVDEQHRFGVRQRASLARAARRTSCS